MARPPSDIAPRVLAAARTRFLAEGVDGASLRAIAREAGTNLGMVYYYFPSKDALFLAVIEDVYASLLEDLTRILSDAGEHTGERLEALYLRFASMSDEEVQVIRLIMREALGSSERIRGLWGRFSQGHIPLFLSLLQAGRARGEVRSDVPPLVTMVGAIASGLVPQLLRRGMSEAGLPVAEMLPDAEALARLLAQIILEGLTPRSEASGG